MKISASIYSDAARPLQAVIADLVAHQVDLLHIDCNDDLRVFDDIKKIREWCTLPLDLHIITADPAKFYPYLLENPVEYLTFQVEDLKTELQIPAAITGKKGLAVITPTPISAFEPYEHFDFILIMATIPGQSGGVFDRLNFDKIRSFRKRYPNKSIHVDGGVNPEVSFILRQMGVSTAVSGSYLFKEASVGNALMNLTKRSIGSAFKVADFMTPLHETPKFSIENLDLKNVLQTGVMAWDFHANSFIFTDFVMNYENLKNQFRGDGEYLNTKINPYHRKLLQHEYPGKLKSYKYDIYPGPPEKDVSIVCFHGRPSIVQALEHSITTPLATYEPQNWIKDYWYH